MDILEADKKARNRIISETNRNFFVEAGAGSGKTTMLVNRMVAMVESDDNIDISKIAAITFTKAAAGEFYERFQKILIDRSNPDYEWPDECKAGQLPKPTEETRRRCEEALKNIDLCFMGTIDSFCNVVLSEHPSEAGILSDSCIVTPEEEKVLYQRMYVRICNGEFGPELQSLSNTFRAVHKKDQEVFLLGMKKLMDNRNVHFNYNTANPVDIDKDYADIRKQLISAVKCLKEHSECIHDTVKSKEGYSYITDIYKAVCNRWSYDLTNLLAMLNKMKIIAVTPKAMEDYGLFLSGFFEPAGKTGKSYKCTIEDEGGILSELRNIQYDASMTFLQKCVDTIAKEMHDAGQLTFFDYQYYLRNMLRKDAEGDGTLIKYIYDRHSYFLLDEFQDTNPIQAEIFFYLASENPVSKWYECKPRPGSLFIVGDPKQSIYRFRSADVRSYIRVKDLFAKDEQLELTQNFRSKRSLVHHYNLVFEKMLPEETPIQSKFNKIPLPDAVPDEFDGVYRYCTHDKKENEPEQVGNIIKELVDNPQYLIRGKDDPKDKEGKVPLRTIRYSDIMVITVNKDHLKEIMLQLNDMSIPMKVEGQVLFDRSEAFLMLFNLYASVVDNDAVALYGALTGKLFALTKEELMVFKTCDGKISLTRDFDRSGCTNETALKVADAIDRLKELNSLSRGMSPAALLAHILDEYKLYSIVNADNMEIIYYMLELVRNAEKAGVIKTHLDCRDFLNRIMSDDSDVERCLSLNKKEDRVHLANLHKVKGLEAPVIILAKAQKNNGLSGSIRIVHEKDKVEGYVISLSKKGANTALFQTNVFDEQKAEETAELKAEILREVYVAATRARNVLIINDYNGKGNIWYDLLLDFDPDNDPVPQFPLEENEDADKGADPDIVKVNADELYKKAEEEQVLKKDKEGKRASEKNSYIGQTPSKLELVSKTEEAGSEGSAKAIVSNPTDEAAELRAFADIMGTMVHKFMEVLVSSKGRIDCNNVITEIISEHRTQQMIPYEAKVRASLEKIAATITNGGYPQPNGLPQDILKTLLAAEDVRCEVPFCYREATPEGTVIWNGIIDVMYCEGGKWHIVDYKTNADGEDLDTKYQNQLSAYVKAFKDTTGNEADARIYHIEL